MDVKAKNVKGAKGAKVKADASAAKTVVAVAMLPPVPAPVLAPSVEAPHPLDVLARGLKDAGDAAGHAIGEAVQFVGRFASDAKFRDDTLFGAVEVAQAAEAVVCTLAAVTNDPNVKWLCGRAQVLARGAEELRRRTGR